MGSGSVVNYGDNNKHIIASMASVTTKTAFYPLSLGWIVYIVKKRADRFVCSTSGGKGGIRPTKSESRYLIKKRRTISPSNKPLSYRLNPHHK